MPFTVSYPLGLLKTCAPPAAGVCGGTGATGAPAPPLLPLTQTPPKCDATVPHGQTLSAAAGDATTQGAAANATAQQRTSTPRFSVTIYALRTSQPTRPSVTHTRPWRPLRNKQPH